MGYMGNHLATISTAAFAAVLTGLWFYFIDFAPALNFVFIMAVPITWFLAITCWLAQKSVDYVHNPNTGKYTVTVHSPQQQKSNNTGAPIVTTYSNTNNSPSQNAEQQYGAITTKQNTV